MICNQAFNDLLDGTIALGDLTREQLTRLWGCIDQNQQRLLQALVAPAGGSGIPASTVAAFTFGATDTIPAGAHSVLVVKTNADGTTDLLGQSLAAIGSSMSLEAPPYKTLPQITITPTGAPPSTHAWTAIT